MCYDAAMQMHRRSLITGLVSLVAAPAVIRSAGLLMPVKAIPEELVNSWGRSSMEMTATEVLARQAAAYESLRVHVEHLAQLQQADIPAYWLRRAFDRRRRINEAVLASTSSE